MIFLLVFLYLTRLKARQILLKLVKNISLYFKRRHLIIYKSLIFVAVHIDSDVTERDDCYCKMKTNKEIVTGLEKNAQAQIKRSRTLKCDDKKTELD